MMTAEATAPDPANLVSDHTEELHANAERIRESFVEEAVAKGFAASADEASGRLEQTERELDAEHSLTVNMTAASMGRFLERGRAETFWDHAAEVGADAMNGTPTVNGKSIHGRYEEFRRTAEDGLRQYAPGDATRHDPVYAAVAGPSNRDRTRGAAPANGNWWVTLDSRFEDRSVYNFADSHAALVHAADGGLQFDTSTVLDAAGALTAKAVDDLVAQHTRSLGFSYINEGMVVNADTSRMMSVAGRRGGYVEAVIFDEVTPADVAHVSASLLSDGAIAEAGQLLREHPSLAGPNLTIYSDSDMSPMVRDWLSQRTTLTLMGGGADELLQPSGLWAELGLSPDADQQAVGGALTERATALWRELNRFHGAIPLLPGYRDGGSWHNHLSSLRAWSNTAVGQKQEMLRQFMTLQQARAFFSV